MESRCRGDARLIRIPVICRDMHAQIYRLFTGREDMGKNCARGLEYGLGPYSRPRAQFFSHTDRPSPVNNMFIFFPAVNWFHRVQSVRLRNSCQ